MIGEIIGNYRVTGSLGTGGMGAVYVAQHTLIGRKAALKVLLPELSNSKRQVQRFFNEAKAASAVEHPGIVEIFDFGFHNGRAFILMEYLDGESLETRLKRIRVLPVNEALHLLRQVAGALAAAHDQEIVHRDLKPDNIFIISDPEVTGGERVKLLDFGIAKLTSRGPADMKTRTGTVMGTPSYMAPEQCRGAERVDQRADLYSLGCILYRMVCGQPPFVAPYSGDILAMQIMTPPPPPTTLAPDLPVPVANFILHLLAKNPAERPPDARVLIRELDEVAHASMGRSLYGRIPTNHELSQPSLVDARVPGHTTLASSAGVVANPSPITTPPQPRARMGLFAALVLALVGVGVGAGVMWSGKQSSQPATARSSAAPPTTEQSGAQDSDRDIPVDRPITILSDPAGAMVMRGSDELGPTPYATRAEVISGAVLTVRSDGYRPHTIELPDRPESFEGFPGMDERGQIAIALVPDPEAAENAQSGTTSEASERQPSGESNRQSPTQSGEKKSGEKKSGEKKSGEKKSGEKKSGKKKSGKKKSGKKKSGEKKSGKKKSGKKKSGKKKSGKRDEDGFLIDGI